MLREDDLPPLLEDHFFAEDRHYFSPADLPFDHHVKLEHEVETLPSPDKEAEARPEQPSRIKGHWNLKQRKKYHVFLEIYHKNFEEKHLRRADKIFKVMSEFIGTREADQCRSHHQKMEKKYNSFYNILRNLRLAHLGSASLDLLLELVREVGRSALARENYLSEAVLCGEQAVKEIEDNYHSLDQAMLSLHS